MPLTLYSLCSPASLPAPVHPLAPPYPTSVQMAAQRRLEPNSPGGRIRPGEVAVASEERPIYGFADLFKAIRIEDFSSYISKVGSRGCNWQG